MARKTQSKMNRVVDAYETLTTSVAEFFAAWSAEGGDISGLVCAFECARDEVAEVAEEYREAEAAFPNGGGLADALAEKADMLEDWSSALDSATTDIAEFDEGDVEFEEDTVDRREGETEEGYAARIEEAREAAVREAREEWRDEVRRIAEDAMDNYPL